MTEGEGARGTRREHRRGWVFLGVLTVLTVAATAVLVRHQQHEDAETFVRPNLACSTAGNGGLIGFDARTGARRWTRVTQNEPSLAVRRAAVVVTTHPTGAISRVQTVDPDTGDLSACTTVADGETDAAASATATTYPLAKPIEFDGLTIARWDDGIRATDAQGRGVWGVAHTRDTSRIGDDLLVTKLDPTAPRRSRVALIDLKTGAERWGGPGWSAHELPGDGPLVIISGDGSQVRAVDPADGTTIWSTRLPASPIRDGFVDGKPIGGLLLFPTGEGGHVTAVDPTTGSVRWTTDGGSPAQVGRVYKPNSGPGTYLPGIVSDAVTAPDGNTLVVAVRAYDPVADD